MKKKELLYIEIANGIEHQIKNDVLKVGDKLPSLRTICQEKGVSLSTAMQSYFELESRGLIESRPQSGYYVSYTYKNFRDVPSTSQPAVTHADDAVEDIISVVSKNYSKATISFSLGVP